jgi:aspartate aminotransferase-like enzyme
MTPPAAFGRFFLPGPTEVRPEILAAQTHPMIGHRGKGMEQLIAGMMPALQRVFRTSRPVYISASSATGMMEAAIRNGVRRRVLCLVNGAFSERFFAIATACGVEAESLTVPLGQAHTPEMLADALRGRDFDAVTVVHSETSTGVLNPIADLARVCHESGDVVLLVDSVTGIAGTPVETDAWGIDFVLTGSQKALALPPGLAFAVAHTGILERARLARNRGLYFDLVEFEQYIATNQTPNTPALSLIYAAAAQLARIDAETIEGRWARHRAMAERTWSWVDEMRERGVALRMLASAGFRSPTVSCIRLPEGIAGTAINDAMTARGFTIATGYGKLKNESIRIGHMGDHTVQELDALLVVLEQVLATAARMVPA